MTPTETKLAALDKIISAVRAYLPPDGMTKDQFISTVIEAVDNPEFNEAKMSDEKTIEALARMWMQCDPNRQPCDPDEIIGQSCSGSSDGPTECHDTPLTGKPRWHWFIPRAESSLKFLRESGVLS